MSTASRVLRGRGYASDATRERVLRAARELEYEPHHAARSLRSRSSGMIGVVIQDVTNPFYSFVAKGIADVMRRNGLVVISSDSEESDDREAESLRVMLRTRVEGVIVTPTAGDGAVLQLLQRQGISIVQVDRTIAGVSSDTVVIDNYGGAYAATRHLIDLGHTAIAVAAGPQNGDDRPRAPRGVRGGHARRGRPGARGARQGHRLPP